MQIGWLLCTIITPLLWAACNILDESLVQKHFPNKAFTFIVMVAALEIIPGSLIYLSYAPAHSVHLGESVFIGAIGVLFALSFIPYIYALHKDRAAQVIPLFKLSPVLVLALGWMIFGEALSSHALLACGLIILAAIGISWDFTAGRIGMRTLGLMSICALGYSICALGIRWKTRNLDYLTVFGLMDLGAGCAGMAILLLHRGARQSVVKVVRAGKSNLVTFFLIAALMDIMGAVFYVRAMALAPTAGIVQSITSGLQPFFVFVLTLILSFLFPQYWEKMKVDRVMGWRIGCIAVLIAGVILLERSMTSVATNF